MPYDDAYESGSDVVLTAEFHNESNQLDDPATVTLTLTDPAGVETAVPMAGLTHPATGIWTYQLANPGLGSWRYTFTGAGGVDTERSGSFIVVTAVPDAPRGFCSAWVSVPTDPTVAVDPLLGCPGVDLTDQRLRAVAVMMADVATTTLFQASFQRFPGPCTVRQHVCPGSSRRHGRYESGFWCGLGTRLELPATVEAVLAVEIDGIPMDPSAYRLHGNVLTRCDGIAWPACPEACAATATGLMVEYVWGTPPLGGRLAAARLTCELVRLHEKQSSSLPAGTTSVTRQNVTLTRELVEFLRRGHSGIWEVEQFLGSFGHPEPQVVFPEQVQPVDWAAQARMGW